MKKTAIITGAMGGIGFATVNQLVKDGFTVVGFDVLPEDIANKSFKDIENAFYVSGDLTNGADRKRVLDFALSKFKRVDVLINVAGVAPLKRTDLLDMNEESYDRVMEINTKATLFMTQLAARQMILQKTESKVRGYIVNISSMSAYTSSINRGEYCISKAGVSMLTKLFADRLAGEGILVNEIRPGIIATGMTAAVKQKYDDLIAQGILPIARWGEPEDIANAVSILCSGKLSYTTGQSIDVDGGFHMRRL